jgi:hypothetical protein
MKDLGLLSGRQTIQNDLNAQSDRHDTYRFSLAHSSAFNLALTGLHASAEARLYRNTNRNGSLDTSDPLIATTSRGGSFDEALNYANLNAGSYFVRVSLEENANTPYKLDLSTSNPSDLLPVEFDAGSIMGSKTLEGSVNNANTTDTYAFNLSADSDLNLSLHALSANADLRLILDRNYNSVLDGTDEIIGTSRNGGTSPEMINLQGLNAGNYLVQINQVLGATDYVLDITTPHVAYTFTYYYDDVGSGDYYRGYGYTKPGESFTSGQRIDQLEPNETGSIGFYIIDSVAPTKYRSYDGQVSVTEYFDSETGILSDFDRTSTDNRRKQGHLHYNDRPSFQGRGFSGLGSESGIIHKDNHHPNSSFETASANIGYFSNFYEADLLPF